MKAYLLSLLNCKSRRFHEAMAFFVILGFIFFPQYAALYTLYALIYLPVFIAYTYLFTSYGVNGNLALFTK